ncbi:MAG: hypothetical protein IPN90_10170 [Elusimicrobia bacterium]|nr:hypothetical protein [Elusimicrobiota bacterium]
MKERAETPFRFFTRLTLTTLTGLRAGSGRELMEGIHTVPDNVIYQHTHRFLQQHQFLTPEPPNDFAYWATQMLGDEELGERLTSVDTVRFSNLAELRRALSSAIEKHLEKRGDGRAAPAGKEFHFTGAVRFSIPTPHAAESLTEFAEALRKVSIASLYLHIYEARLRPPHVINDFSNWFERELGRPALAKKVAGLDPYTHTLEGLRAKIISFIEQEESHGQA